MTVTIRSSDNPRIGSRLALAGIVAAFVGVHLPCLGHEFVWDEVALLATSPVLDRPLSESILLTEHARAPGNVTELRGGVVAHESFRPLLHATWAAEVALAGRSPRLMHATNIVLGAVGILLAWALARRLLGETWPALVVAAGFALHPVHVEAVAYVAARADLLAGILSLAALLVMSAGGDRGRHQAARAAGAALLWMAGMFVKEAGAALSLAGLGLALALGRVRAWRWPLAALGAAVPLYLALRAALIPHAPTAVQASGVGRAALELPGIALQYLGIFIGPTALSIDRPFREGLVAPGWVAAAALCAGALALARRRDMVPTRRTALGVALAGVAWVGLATGPGAVAVRTMGAVSDRYAYTALFGFLLALAASLREVVRSKPALKRIAAGSALVWVAAMTALSAAQVPVWRNNGTLYSHNHAVEPASSMATYRIGFLLSIQGRWREATEYFERSIALDPTNTRALNNLGVARLNVGDLGGAERSFREALARSDGLSFKAAYNLGAIALQRGQLPEACRRMEEALRILPTYEVARRDRDRFCAGKSASPSAKP